MKKIRLLHDHLGNWYAIPNELAPVFKYDLYENEDFLDTRKGFYEKYEKYHTGTDVNSIQLYIR